MLASHFSMLSVIIPIRGEPASSAAGVAPLASRPDVELIVVCGGGPKETREAFRRIGGRVLSADGPRGARLDLGARQARGEYLLFLHADSTPPADAPEAISRALARPIAGGAFTLAYDDPTRPMRWIAWWANLRARRMHLPFGDQGLFVRRDEYHAVGGFRSFPICDDLDFVRRLKRRGPIAILPQRIVTSSRRYRGRAFGQVCTNWRVLAGFYAGVSPGRLEKWYRRNGRSEEIEGSRGERTPR
jgi:uncharacterized protein